RIPPLAEMTRLLALGRTAAGDVAFEELALELAGAAVHAVNGAGETRAGPSAQDEKRISAAIRFMEENAHEKLTVAGLARVVHMSPYHFVRTFKRVTGVPPHQLLLRQRLLRAATLIRAGGEAISSIAFGAGFNDLSTFNRMFRNAIGVSPSQFRKELAKGI